MSTYFHTKLLGLLNFFVTPRRKNIFYFEWYLLARNNLRLFRAGRLWSAYIHT